MKFQLVLQFPAAGMRQFDGLVALEEDLIQNLLPTSESPVMTSNRVSSIFSSSRIIQGIPSMPLES